MKEFLRVNLTFDPFLSIWMGWLFFNRVMIWGHILPYISKSVLHCVTLAHHLINYMATHLSQAPFARIEISIFRACQLAQSYYKSTVKTSKKLLIWADENGQLF